MERKFHKIYKGSQHFNPPSLPSIIYICLIIVLKDLKPFELHDMIVGNNTERGGESVLAKQ